MGSTYELVVQGTTYTFELEGDLWSVFEWVEQYLSDLGGVYRLDGCGEVVYTIRRGDSMWVRAWACGS